MKIVIMFSLAFTLITACVANTRSGSISASKPEAELVLVTGITGNQGSGVAEAVLAKGFEVRGLSRNINSETSKAWAARGVEMVQGDYMTMNRLKQRCRA